jgi:hypothetical protein
MVFSFKELGMNKINVNFYIKKSIQWKNYFELMEAIIILFFRKLQRLSNRQYSLVPSGNFLQIIIGNLRWRNSSWNLFL